MAMAMDQRPGDSPTLRTALAAWDVGICVVPPNGPGHEEPKSPLFERVEGRSTWKHFQSERPDRAKVERWYAEGRTWVGAVCGAVSGGLELFEFDNRETYDAFLKAAKACGYGGLVARIEGGYCEDTPGGGVHWFYYSDEVQGNTKLARRDTGRPILDPTTGDPVMHKGTGRPLTEVEVLIETRGEGGYAVISPTIGLHPNGRGYTLRSGGVDSIATLDSEERDALWDLARSFDEMPGPDAPEPEKPKPETTGQRGGEVQSGTDFNARSTWDEILAGWTKLHTTSAGATYWRRPGKTHGWSATTNHKGNDRLNVFSSSTEFEPVLDARKTYDKFGAYAALHHRGDLKATARDLAASGYGTYWNEKTGQYRQNPRPKPGDRIRVNGQAMGLNDAKDALDAPPTPENDNSDDDIPVEVRPWPVPPDDAVWRGLAGQIACAVDPLTEADPVAVLISILAGFGNLIGRRPYAQVNSTRHYTNLFVCTAGPSGVGRKGTAWEIVRDLFRQIDPEWASKRILGGLTSGEGLIAAVRDPTEEEEDIKDRGRVVGRQLVLKDPGVTDKRLLAVETEFGRTLKVLSREGNILDGVIRQAWDSGNLGTMTRNNPLRATDAHVSIISHITEGEAGRYLTENQAGNGFANRILWPCVRRSKLLPRGALIDFRSPSLLPLVEYLGDVVSAVRDFDNIMVRSIDAEMLWESVYDDLTDGRPGLLGVITSRGDAQTLRLSCLYALLDGRTVVQTSHLESALAFWRYCERSAAYIFGDALGDRDADRLLSELRSGPDGLSQKQIYADVFQKHKSRDEIARILGRLLEYDRVVSETVPTGGRPRTIWRARRSASRCAKND